MLITAPGSVGCSVGRRVVPPEEPGIVPQPGRERPPTRPPRLVPGPLRGVAHVPAAWLRFEMDWARDRVGTLPRDSAPSVPPFVARTAPNLGGDLLTVQPVRSRRCL